MLTKESGWGGVCRWWLSTLKCLIWGIVVEFLNPEYPSFPSILTRVVGGNTGVWRWTRPRAHLIHVLPLLVVALPKGTAGVQETLQGKTTLAGQAIPWASFLFKPATGPTCSVRVYALSKVYWFYLLLKFKLFLLSESFCEFQQILPYWFLEGLRSTGKLQMWWDAPPTFKAGIWRVVRYGALGLDDGIWGIGTRWQKKLAKEKAGPR